jgi:L-asparagine transporter-like permease
MVSNKIIQDGIIGGIIVALFSYMASLYNENNNYLKITAYLWGAPLFYFYLIYVTYSNSSKKIDAVKDFTIHATIGTILTVLVMIITIFISHEPIYKIILINIILLIIFIYVYFAYKLYEIF